MIYFQHTFFLLYLFSSLAGIAQVQPTPDIYGEVRETKFGIDLHDPYRGFENLEDATVQQWINGKNGQAQNILEKAPNYTAIHHELQKLTAATSVRARVPIVNQAYSYVLQSLSEDDSYRVLRYRDPLCCSQSSADCSALSVIARPRIRIPVFRCCTSCCFWARRLSLMA